MEVKFDDLLLAFDFVSFGGPGENVAYVSLDTGAIYWIMDDREEDIPADIDTSDRYVAVCCSDS